MPLQIVVPMAGEGKRFKDAGYEIPKPLIPVAGAPMVVRAVKDLPIAQRVVFLVRREHVEEHGIESQLRAHFPDCRIVVAEKLTEGQACTVRLAADELEPEWPVIVAACDNTHLYDEGKLNRAMSLSSVECLVWTYRGEPRVAIKPEQYGWVRVEGDKVLNVSCKAPVSENPIQDHVISGFFTFRCAGRMIEAIDMMIAADRRVNNEFYMDIVPNEMIARGLDVRVFEVDKYIGWGTPADLEDFGNWERYFEHLHG